MLKFLKIHRGLLLLNCSLILFVSLFFNLTTPSVFKLLIEGVLPDGNERAFALGAMALLLVTFGRGLFGMIQDYVFLLHRQLLEVSALKCAVARTDLKKINIQTTFAIIRNYVANFQYFWIEFVFYIAYAVFISVVVLVTFYLIEPAYFWLAFGFMLAHAFNFVAFKRPVNALATKFNAAKSGFILEVDSHLKSLKEVKSVNGENFLAARATYYSDLYSTSYARKEILNFIQRLVQDAFINIFYVVFFCAALYLSATRELSIGSAALAVFLSSLLFEPIYRFSSIIKSYYEARQFSLWVPEQMNQKERHLSRPSQIRLRNALTQVMQRRGAAPLNFTFDIGEIYLVTGPSGCGKSTLLDCLAGFDQLAAGEISFGINDKDKSGVYYCEQQAAVFPGTIFENIAFYSVKPDIKLIEELIVHTNLEVLTRPMSLTGISNELSSGQKQRLAVARSLYCSNTVILYDEPTSAQDEENEHLLFARLAEEAKKRIVIVASHSHVAERYAGKVLKMT